MHVLKRIIEPVARTPFVLPIVLVLALLGILITETTYRSARSTMHGAMALTDARIKAAELLQAMSDHEFTTLTYLLTGDVAESARQKSTAQKVGRLQQEAFGLIQRLDTAGTVSVDAVRTLIDEQMGRLDQWQKLASSGQHAEARSQSVGYTGLRGREDMRNAFESVLQRTAALQHSSRVSVNDALMRSRIAIHLLMALTVLAMMLFVRSLRQADRLKDEEKARLAALVDARTTSLRELAGHLVTAREDERAHLARELHDEMGGLFTVMKLELTRLRRITSMPDGAGERLAAVDARLSEGIALKRRIIENLRPSSLDQLGLAPALELLCKDISANLGVPVHTLVEPVKVAADIELTIYRLVQESLTNISKYAGSSEVTVSLRPVKDGRIEVAIVDNGCGFDTTAVEVGRHGLLGMRFRVESHAGILTIRSAPGSGTVVTATLPSEPAGSDATGQART